MKYVISPYLIMSAPAVLFMILDFNFIEKSWIYNTGLMNKSVITDILLLEITGSQWYHFWFIPMMIIFYLLAPAFRFVANNPGIYYIIPFIIIISFVVGRPADNSNPFQSFLYYLPVYLLGSFSSQFYSQVRKAIIKYWHFLVILFLFSSYIIYSGSVSSVSLFQKVILCYIVLALMINHDHSEAPVLEILAKYSFGIYFIHMYVIHLVSGIISFLELGFLRSLGIFSYFLFLALVTYISYLFLRVSKMILKENSRMIIGC
jgi:peptidoglycan/LPS O-acetylase OafA/YrhL